jgi:hypothetical protein
MIQTAFSPEPGQGGFQFWKSLHKVKHFFKLGAKYLVGDGHQTCFGLTGGPGGRGALKDTFPYLFSVYENPSQLVASVCALGDPHIRFHRSQGQEAIWPSGISSFSALTVSLHGLYSVQLIHVSKTFACMGLLSPITRMFRLPGSL